MEAALFLGRQALLEEEQEESLYLEGAANMLSWQEFASPAKLRRLMAAIEEKSRLLHLLDKSIRSDGIQIFIGEEMPIPEMKEMSLIAAPYGPAGHILGVLGVIGPTRMEYSRVIPIVEYMAVSPLRDWPGSPWLARSRHRACRPDAQPGCRSSCPHCRA